MMRKLLMIFAVLILFSAAARADEVQVRPIVVVPQAKTTGSEQDALSPRQKAFLEEVREEKRLLRRPAGESDQEQKARAALAERKEALKQEQAAIKNDLDNGIAQLYGKGLRLYREKKFEEARTVFIEIDRISPNYKKTQSYLKNIKRRKASPRKPVKTARPVIVPAEKIVKQAAKNQNKNEILSLAELEENYIYAVSLYNHEKFAEAKKLFEKVNQIRPGHKLTERYLALIEKQKASKLSRREQPPKTENIKATRPRQNFSWKIPVETESVPAANERQEGPEYAHAKALYAQAMRYYLDHDHEHARAKFMAVERVSPNYKNTREYLRRLENLGGKINQF